MFSSCWVFLNEIYLFPHNKVCINLTEKLIFNQKTYLNLRFSFSLILGLNLEDPVGLPDNLAALNSIVTLVQNSHLITLKRKTDKNYCFMARSHGLVVKADSLWPRGCGFKPWHHILDLLAITLKKNCK